MDRVIPERHPHLSSERPRGVLLEAI